MKKTLLFIAACAMSTMSFAQTEQKQSILMDIPEVEVNVNETEDAEAIEAADQTTAPVFCIKRPAGLFFPGYQQTKATNLTIPYAKAPAYVPLTWELYKKDWSGNTATGTFSLAVPYAKTVNDEAADWIISDGSAVEGSLIAMGNKFYPSPYATGVNEQGETVFTLLPPYVSDGTTNPAIVYAGGALSKSTSGYQMAANYNVYWGTGFSSSSKYYGFNTKASNDGWISRGYADAKVKGICEKFDKPASPYILKGANWWFNKPSEGSAGTLKLTIRKMEGNIIGEVIAVSYCEEPTANTTTRMIYLFDNLEDADGNKVAQVIIDSAIMIEVAPMDDDEDTNIVAYYVAAPYYSGDSNAYVHLNYDKNGTPAETWTKASFKWTKSDGTVTYQCSFTCGLVIEYPFAKVLDKATGVPTTENIMNVPAEGGKQEFFFDAYYNYGVWKIYSEDGTVEVNYDSEAKTWKPNVDWLKITTESGKNESGNFNGDVTMTIECAANSGAEETKTLIVDCYGFKEPITIKRAGSTAGIADVVADKASKFNVTYNLAGQAVSRNYKGVVIKNGVKAFAK